MDSQDFCIQRSTIFDSMGRICPLTLRCQGGVMHAEQVRTWCRSTKESVDDLMARLLPLARDCATAPVSELRVGAVAQGEAKPGVGYPSLYLGANFEFIGQPITATLHAEQIALASAWVHGERRCYAMAVSAAPCGLCRQFLAEWDRRGSTRLLLIPAIAQRPAFARSSVIEVQTLAQLLPQAFDVEAYCRHGGREHATHRRRLRISAAADEPLVRRALCVAEDAYAPYSGNRAGCVLSLADGRSVCGASLESAAYTPALSAFAAAFGRLRLSGVSDPSRALQHVVLVELVTRSSQVDELRLRLPYCAPGATLAYHRAVC